jgi:Na+-translocating ferredoxin:NAD+ oxidoreductase RNF subunit RnfB
VISRRQFLRGRFSAATESTPGNDPAAPKLAQISIACIAYAQNVVCRSCGDACEPAAIHFSPQPGGTALPSVLAEQCTGCGDCVPVCPTSAILLATLAGQKPK